MKKAITPKNAPPALGPYSYAIETGNTVYVSGQLPITQDGKLIDDIKEATKLMLENMAAVLKGAGLELNHVVKTTVFLRDMNQFAEMNSVYETFFASPFPARSCVQVARLPKDAVVEAECIAVRP